MNFTIEKEIISKFLNSLNRCPICYENFEDNVWFLSCKCKIAFHQQCIFQSFQRIGHICPQCRQRVNNNLFRIKPDCLFPSDFNEIYEKHLSKYQTNTLEKINYYFLFKILIGFKKLNKYPYQFKQPIPFYKELNISAINFGTDGTELKDILSRYDLAVNMLNVSLKEKVIGEQVFIENEDKFFHERLMALTGPDNPSFFADINFDGVFLGGGSIFKAMSTYFTTEQILNDPNIDLDFFVYGKTASERWNAFSNFLINLKKKYQKRVFFYPTGAVVDIHIQGFPRKIQLIYGNFESIDEILHAFDFYHIRAGFDGKNLLVCPEAILAQIGRVAVIDKFYASKYNVNRVAKVKELPYEMITYNKGLPIYLYIKNDKLPKEALYLPNDLSIEGVIIRLATLYKVEPYKIIDTEDKLNEFIQSFDHNSVDMKQSGGMKHYSESNTNTLLNLNDNKKFLDNYQFDPQFIPQIFKYSNLRLLGDIKSTIAYEINIPVLKLRFELPYVAHIERSVLIAKSIWSVVGNTFYQCKLEGISDESEKIIKALLYEITFIVKKNIPDSYAFIKNENFNVFSVFIKKLKNGKCPLINNAKSLIVEPSIVEVNKEDKYVSITFSIESMV